MSNNERRTKLGRGRAILFITLAVVVVIFALRFLQVSGREPVASIGSVQQAEGKPVEVIAAAVGDLESWTNLAGTVEGSFQYPIISTNSITVVAVTKREGTPVKAGDVVIRLEKTASNPMLYSYNRSLAIYQDAIADLDRMRNLYQEGAVSKQALDKAELAVEVAKSDLANARGSTDLAATHAGVVTSVLVKEGQMAEAYRPLAWVARTDSVRVSFKAGSRQAMALRAGQKARWESHATGEKVMGHISKLDLAADPQSHLVNGEILFPNPGQKLMPGVLVSFRVLTGERSGVVKIPTDCLREKGGAYSVFVAEPGSNGKMTARLRDVTPGLRTTDEVEILQGLAAGDRVVEFGQALIADGDLLKVVRGREVK